MLFIQIQLLKKKKLIKLRGERKQTLLVQSVSHILGSSVGPQNPTLVGRWIYLHCFLRILVSSGL